MKKISAKQQQILDYISSYSLEHGYPPSVREIGAEMGLRSPSTVHAHLKKLQEAGYLEPNEHKSRALTPVMSSSMRIMVGSSCPSSSSFRRFDSMQ